MRKKKKKKTVRSFTMTNLTGWGGGAHPLFRPPRFNLGLYYGLLLRYGVKLNIRNARQEGFT